ncbi:hypothetical protein NKG05_08415 [Oerskovia sp. M15]
MGVELDATDARGEVPARPWDAVGRLAAGDPTWTDVAHPAVRASSGATASRRRSSRSSPTRSSRGRRPHRDARLPHVRRGLRGRLAPQVGAGAPVRAAGPDRRHRVRDRWSPGARRGRAAPARVRPVRGRRRATPRGRGRAQEDAGVFANPNVWFVQANILRGSVMPERSVDTTVTIALTHEISSYGEGVPDVERFARRVLVHTRPGGVWINSDVCGPADGSRRVHLALRDDDGTNPGVVTDLDAWSRPDVAAHVRGLSTAARMRQFAHDFPRLSGATFAAEEVAPGTFGLTLRDAMEFLTTKDYADNWLSECHERFCDLDGDAWAACSRVPGSSWDPRAGMAQRVARRALVRTRGVVDRRGDGRARRVARHARADGRSPPVLGG